MKKDSFLIYLFILTSFSGLKAQFDLSTVEARLRNHVAVLASDSCEGRGLGTAGKDRAMKYIENQFAEIGLDPVRDSSYSLPFSFKIGLARVSAANIAGMIRGADPVLKDEIIVIGAHYDHLGYNLVKKEKIIFPGADDNASGVASMIELARSFMARKVDLKRTLIFIAFDAEESGLLGSKYFTGDTSLCKPEKVKAMFSLDMVGMYNPKYGLSLTGIGSLKEGARLAETLAQRTGINLNNTSGSIAAFTDTWPFGEKGIPAVHAYTGKRSPYHKTGDTGEKLEYREMTKIVGFLGELITEISAESELKSSILSLTGKEADKSSLHAGFILSAGASRFRFPEEFYIAKSTFSGTAGMFLRWDIGKRVALQPEIEYLYDGSRTAAGTFRRHSLMVPLNIHLNVINMQDGMVKFYPFAGAYFLYGFSMNKLDDSSAPPQHFTDTEWGMNVGVGFTMMKWQVKGTWQQSLTNLSDVDGQSVYPSRWNFSVAYQIW
jgi:hypothetical protein